MIDFLGSTHDFYEGKYFNEVHYRPHGRGLGRLPLWLIRSGHIWAVRREVEADGVVVELGCAAGVRWFASAYRMIGLDFSKAALTRAAIDYRLGLCADALRIPLADESVDAVVSASFFEHIAPSDKPLLLAELMRILRPGGKIVFEHDVETANPMIASYRKSDPALYNRLFLEGDGHTGYEPHATNDAHFRAAGFNLLWSQTIERLPLQSTDVYAKLGQWPGRRGRLSSFAARMSRGVMAKPWQALIRIADVSIGRLAPSSWGRIAITVAQKPR
ncbi:MAG: class I SAM-dependent methyltransferase [Sphingomicrobium sp.]